MAVEKVREYLKEYHMEDRILEFDVSSATVELAAQAVGCEPERIAKTMSFLVNEEVILIVTAGDVKIDNKKYKQHFHAKAKMIPFEEVEEYTGHAPGGVCPFAVREGVRAYLDESLKLSLIHILWEGRYRGNDKLWKRCCTICLCLERWNLCEAYGGRIFHTEGKKHQRQRNHAGC